MNWHNVIDMGGYGTYVWSAYSITLFAFAMNLFISTREKKRARKLIQQFLRHES